MEFAAARFKRGAGLRPAMPPFMAAFLDPTKCRHECRHCRPEARSTFFRTFLTPATAQKRAVYKARVAPNVSEGNELSTQSATSKTPTAASAFPGTAATVR